MPSKAKEAGSGTAAGMEAKAGVALALYLEAAPHFMANDCSRMVVAVLEDVTGKPTTMVA